MKRLTKSGLLRALTRLGEIAVKNETEVELCLYGGAAMMLAYDRRAITRDVDSLFHPVKKVKIWAKQVAEEQELPQRWLNDDVRQYIAPKESLRNVGVEVPGLRIVVPTAGYLLAMKALAGRRALPGYEGDEADLRYLIKKMGIRSVDEIQEHIDKYFPDDVPPPGAVDLMKTIIREVWRNED